MNMAWLIDSLFPHFLEKEPLVKITNDEFLKAIKEVKQERATLEAMEKALQILDKKYESRRLLSLIFLNRATQGDPNELWNRKGFMHCTQQNYLWRELMVESGHLTDNQIELGFSLVAYFSPHQFLKVTVDGKQIAVDPWNYGRGASLGKYAAGFGMREL